MKLAVRLAYPIIAVALIAAASQTGLAQQSPGVTLLGATLTGSRTEVFNTAKDSCELIDIPDAPARAFVDYQDTVHLVSSHYILRENIGPTLDG